MLKTEKTAYNNSRGDTMVKTIRVIIHPAEDAGGYWAESITIRGAFTQGDTIQETEKNMYESFDLLIEDDYPDIKEYTLEFEVQNA